VVNTGASYTTYTKWYEMYLADAGYYEYNIKPSKDKNYEVVAVEPHTSFGGLIYGIMEIGAEDPQVYIIGEYGIELVVREPEVVEEVFEMKSEDAPVYKMGEFVRCISRTKENVEGLILGEVYEMVGASMYDGNLVLSVKAKDGKLFHSIDRFESIEDEKVTEDDIYIMKCDIAPEGYGTDVLNNSIDTLMENTHFGKIPEGCELAPDMVNEPPHYKKGGIECIDYLEAKLGIPAFEGFCIGNTLKYLSRLGEKGDRLEDMLKAQFYLNKAVGLHTAPTEPTEVDGACNRPITGKQIGYIAGLTKKLEIDRYDMPEYISPLMDYKNLSEAEASIVIDRLLAIKDYKDGAR
jgi:hypothetical protein